MSQQTFEFFANRPSVAPQEPVAAPVDRRNLVIEASAGTGKTTAIVGEVLRLMLEHDELAPERIVLMTFTEKAAGEIADRIRTALLDLSAALENESNEAASWPIGSDAPLVTVGDRETARRAIAHHLANIDALRSQTIHSFCQSLLRSFPLEAGLDPQFTIIEGFERSLLYSRVYDEWLDGETRLEPQPEIVAQWELLFTHVGYLFLIRELVLSLADRRDLLQESGYELGSFETVRSLLETIVGQARAYDGPVDDGPIADIFRHLRSNEPRLDTIDEAIDWLDSIAALLAETDLPKKGFAKEIVKALRNSEKKGESIHSQLESHRAAIALVAVTRRFIERLDAEKRRLGVVDFDDLLLRTVALLEEPVVLARARDQFDFIFVDEFQDTDRTQARIIEKLARDGDGRFVPGKTIVVGDPKQSIYGFRRADPETYYRMTQALREEGAERRSIRDQYRSDRPLLEIINRMFTKLFVRTAHDPNVFRPEYEEIRAARTKNRRELDARITMLLSESEEKSERGTGEAEAIARWIAAKRDPDDPKDLQRFAILFRRLTVLDDYLEVFDRYGIDYVLPPTRLFLDRRAPVDLLAVLRAIAYPFDRGAQISAARTPYFALTDVEIANREEPWRAFEQAIAGYRESSRHLTVSGLIDLIISSSGIESVYVATLDTERSASHLEHVRAIAFEYDQRIGGSVRQFVDEIARRRAEPEEMEPTLLDESQNAVRIMSVHAAKGLEFDTVILPDLSFAGGGEKNLRVFTVEEPKHLVVSGTTSSISANFVRVNDEPLSRIASQREEAEMRRLFYVAVTRARTDIAFVCHSAVRNTGFMKCILETIDSTAKALPERWEGDRLQTTPIGEIAFERPPEIAVSGERKRRRLRDAALEESLVSGDIVACIIPEPVPPAVPLQAADVAVGRSAAAARAAGTLLHRTLELWDGTSELPPLLDRLAREVAADRDVVSRVRRRLDVIRRSPVFERIRRAETIGREVPVRFLEGGVVVERRIDRLLRENGVELVLDYKSGKPSAERSARDREQIRRYCDAISAITGRPCRSMLWYVDLEGEAVVEE